MANQIREQFTEFWGKLGKTQKIVLIGLIVAGLVIVPLFFSWANSPSYAVAFSGLGETDAGQIIEQLTEEGIQYQLRNSGTIMVPSDMVYEVRLRMAREGLPQGSTIGFEIFSGTTLGMTEFTQKINYQQALEGELERTIGSLDAVSMVRVHIVLPEKTLLKNDQAPATASVTIDETPGKILDVEQVRSITHLVASSVENLDPENVVVVDVGGNMLAAGGGSDNATAALAANHMAAEHAAAAELRQKIEEILDTVLGPHKSVVQATVSMDWTESETTTQSFDPETSAPRSSTILTETYTTDGALVGGIPGSDTNLPIEGDVDVSGGQTTDYERYEHVTNFELTESQTFTSEAPGAIERISVSVTVDDVIDPEQLETLESVIAAAVGINLTRGDILAVETMEFDRTFYEEQATDIEQGQQTELYIKIGQAVLAGVALIAVLFFIQRMLKRLQQSSAETWTPVLQPVSQVALADSGVPIGAPSYTPAMVPEYQPQLEEAAPAIPEPAPRSLEEIAKEASIQFTTPSAEDEQLQIALEKLAMEDPSKVAEIISIWLIEDGE